MESLEDAAAEYAELELKVRKTRDQIHIRESHLAADRHDLVRLEALRHEARERLVEATHRETR